MSPEVLGNLEGGVGGEGDGMSLPSVKAARVEECWVDSEERVERKDWRSASACSSRVRSLDGRGGDCGSGNCVDCGVGFDNAFGGAVASDSFEFRWLESELHHQPIEID